MIPGVKRGISSNGCKPEKTPPTGTGTKAIISERLKITHGSGNVFHDIGIPREEAENLKLRADLMMRIEDYYKKSGATQVAMAGTLGLAGGLTQSRPN